jgi:cation diffusion facilitator CzcD-associated flavoprotein CzcO
MLHELDVLVLATGFRAHQWGVEQVVGPEGLSLKEAWAEGTRTYRSITIPDFPNFFMMCGPNSPIGNISVIDVSETQATYIIRCLEKILAAEGSTLTPRREASEAFHKDLLEAMKGTVWVTGCNSWYLDEGGVPVLWPWTARRFHQVMRSPRFEDYDFVLRS